MNEESDFVRVSFKIDGRNMNNKNKGGVDWMNRNICIIICYIYLYIYI